MNWKGMARKVFEMTLQKWKGLEGIWNWPGWNGATSHTRMNTSRAQSTILNTVSSFTCFTVKWVTHLKQTIKSPGLHVAKDTHLTYLFSRAECSLRNVLMTQMRSTYREADATKFTKLEVILQSRQVNYVNEESFPATRCCRKGSLPRIPRVVL